MSNRSPSRPASPGGRYGSHNQSRFGGGVSYSDADRDVLFRAVVAITGAGDAVTFGRTSDGGAYYVGTLSGGVLEKFYLDSPEALHNALSGLAETGEALII